MVVAAQIPYPLLPAGGRGRLWLTAAQIVAFFVASASHAALRRGWVFTAGYLVLTIGLGFAAEVVGVRTGWPFGRYSYTGGLGPEIVGVPLLILLGWAMMTYPALLFARWLTHRQGDTPGTRGHDALTAIAGGVLLAGWDLFLDPRMVAEGFWGWAPGGGPALNGIPLTNAVGWLCVGTVLVALVDRLPDPTRRRAPEDGHRLAGDGVPLLLLCWTYGSWVFACLVFFGQLTVALAGGVGMALPLLPVAFLAAARAVRRLAHQPVPPRPDEPRAPRRDLTDTSTGAGPAGPPAPPRKRG
ncbi:carotenoid biosynthesis protein [Pseudofrankia saprophytica]|uniref:carotenoid biosynthesis protein n=1 Tax=Pseudofrankia saprophytica TaxID=298655 RepID=UPI0007C47CDF|nr:carotenoid biosynthesis protein [Pseudofrankia saprophytica]